MSVNLKDCPRSGTGVHAWVYYAACTLIEDGLSDEEAVPIIEDGMTRHPTPHSEIEDALRSARREDKPAGTKWPTRNFLLVAQIMKNPVPDWKPTLTTAVEALELLFPDDPLLCIGMTSSKFTTRRWGMASRLLTRCSLIVPSPMTAVTGQTKAGYPSMHSLDNTGPRHYLIVEFDWGTLEGQGKLLTYLAEYAPLVCVIHSGSKSLHGWFDCRGVDDSQVKEFFELAVSVGADKRLWLRSQFVRLPGGTRDNGAVQHIYFMEKEYLKGKS